MPPRFLPHQVITTRTYDDRLETIANVRNAGINVCSGGILGLGESHQDRIGLLHTLATLPEHPESVPINALGKKTRKKTLIMSYRRVLSLRLLLRRLTHHEKAILLLSIYSPHS